MGNGLVGDLDSVAIEKRYLGAISFDQVGRSRQRGAVDQADRDGRLLERPFLGPVDRLLGILRSEL